jgi:hypothetical protein
MPLNKSWHDYNESLIERGRVLIDVSFLKSSNKEIKRMNIGKVGAPFQYSDSYVLGPVKPGPMVIYRKQCPIEWSYVSLTGLILDNTTVEAKEGGVKYDVHMIT